MPGAFHSCGLAENSRQTKGTIGYLAGMLGGQLGACRSPTTLTWSARATMLAINPDPRFEGDVGPSVFEALQEQLGLRLEARKRTIEIVVVDHMEKTPAEN
jgi:hypothetical protein